MTLYLLVQSPVGPHLAPNPKVEAHVWFHVGLGMPCVEAELLFDDTGDGQQQCCR